MALPKLTATSAGLPPLAAETPLKPLGAKAPESGSALPAIGVGAAAAGGLAALVLKNPAMASKIGRGLNTLRQQLMLSGFALPKSLLGNAGSAVEASLERGSLAPIKAMFSGQTVKDAVAAWKVGAQGGAAQAGQAPMGKNVVTKALSAVSPGRIMGAFDEAAQKALQRAGMGVDEAQTAAMQAPLPSGLAEALDNPAARYIHPFRRQPFNQFLEGWKKFGKTSATNIHTNPGTMTAYTATGAAHGAATADDDTPVSIPLGIAAAARYGLPYGIASLIGRELAGGKGQGNAAGSLLPVSEYGVTSSVTDPTRPFRKPAAITALDKLLGP